MNKTTQVKSFTELKDSLVVSVSDYVNEFGNQMRIGLDAISHAAKIYAEAIRRHPTKAHDAFARAFPSVSANTWDMLTWIGNGDLNPSGYKLPFNIAKKVRRIPMDLQNKIFSDGVNGFNVLNLTTMKPTVVPLDSLSTAQSTLLIDIENGRIRSVDEQKKVLDARPAYFKPKKTDRKKTAQYRICGNVLLVNGIEIGREELRNILSEMDGKNPLRSVL